MKISISCPVGDPLNPSTWSRTPLNIINELKKRECLEEVFNTTINRKISFTIDKLIENSDKKYFNCFLFRKIPKIYLSFQNKIKKSRNILHMGILDLPEKRNKYINHYCLIDYSWDLWFKNQQKNQKHSLSFLQKVESIEYKKLNSAKHIFTTSKFIKDYIHSFYGIAQEKITNVGTGTGIIQPLFDKKRYDFKEILFVAKGRFIDKGGDLVIEVFKKLNIIDPTIRFTILGQDNYKDNFKKISNLNVLGYISQNELQNLFNRSTLFIMPAKNEPWGLVYLEALLCKTPIIGLNKNSFPELCNYGEFGLVIKNENPNEIAQMIYKLINNKGLLELMGNKGQKFVIDNYRWDLTVNKIINTIKETQ